MYGQVLDENISNIFTNLIFHRFWAFLPSGLEVSL
jgi:hypothetical protein